MNRKKKNNKNHKRQYKLSGAKGNYVLKASYYAKNPTTGLYTIKKWRVVKSGLRTKKDAQGWKNVDSLGGRPI